MGFLELFLIGVGLSMDGGMAAWKPPKSRAMIPPCRQRIRSMLSPLQTDTAKASMLSPLISKSC